MTVLHVTLLNPYPQPVQVLGANTYKIPVVPVFNAGRLPFAACEYVHALAAMQAAVIVSNIKANVVAVSGFIKNQSSCFLCHYKILLWVGLQAFALVAGVIGYAPASVSYTHLDVYKRQEEFIAQLKAVWSENKSKHTDIDRERLDEIVSLILETVCTKRKTIRIAGRCV